MSPAEQKIATAQRWIDASPKDSRAYDALALALTARARETADTEYYDQAEEAVMKSLELRPGNFAAAKNRVWILLGVHEFARARSEAESLVHRVPDDLMVYGMLTDANVELGNYEDAEKAAQWMLDLRPGEISGLTRGSYLRELFGDIEGAIEMMSEAQTDMPPDETEHRAWAWTHIGNLELRRGRVDAAERALREAFALYPEYHYALAAWGELQAMRGDHDAAAAALRRHYELAPHPENLYLVGKALARSGRSREAEEAFEEFERAARAESENADNSNRELAFFYADVAKRPEEALRVASLEIGRRRDVFTRDAYAWALHVNGRNDEARREIEAALAVGIRDARMFYHAGEIARGQGDLSAAQKWFRSVLELNPLSEWAALARERLDGSPRSP
jgi:tetratricopeptide (TPR) repeat protein